MQKPRSGTYLDNLPEHLYHNKEHGFSSSDLKQILKTSPQHFKYFYDQPKKEPSEALRTGTVLHCGLLRPDVFDKEIMLMPTFNLKTKAGRYDKSQFLELYNDKVVVNQKEFELGMSMVKACQDNDIVMSLLEGSIKERSFYADILGTPFRARADSYKGSMLIELKSAKDGSQDGFSKQIANLEYHISLVHYTAVICECVEELEMETMEYRFIVVENTAPHVVAIYEPSELMINVAWEKWKEAIGLLQYCLEKDLWPGYVKFVDMEMIDLPPWSIPKDMDN